MCPCMTVKFPFLVPGKDIAWMCTFMCCHVYIFKNIFISGGLWEEWLKKIKYVNIFVSVCVRRAGCLDSWEVRGVCCCALRTLLFIFSLSWFNAPAPPLRPSLLSLLAVHNLIKGQQHSIIIRMADPLPDSLDSSPCARTPLPRSVTLGIKSLAGPAMRFNSWSYLCGGCSKAEESPLPFNI